MKTGKRLFSRFRERTMKTNRSLLWQLCYENDKREIYHVYDELELEVTRMIWETTVVHILGSLIYENR
jgi:chemotaxis methyl-accepting protein methylase